MNRWMIVVVACFVGLLPIVALGEEQRVGGDCWVYVGNYGKREPRGIYLFRMDAATGELVAKGLAGESQHPNFLALHPNGKFLYAVTSAKVAKDYSGAVEAFAIDAATGKLTLLNRQASGGAEPVHLVLDAAGKCAIVANYSGASVALLPIGEDGRLGEATAVVKHSGSSVDPGRQKQPYPHGLAYDGEKNRVLVADLGTDKIVAYDVREGKLVETGAVAVKAGSGPRHIAFDAVSRVAYVANEMSNTVSVVRCEPDGSMKEVQAASPWENAVAGKDYLAEIVLRGGFLYVSERGKDSIGVLRAGEKLEVTQKIECGGKWPRHFEIDPSGRFLVVANQKSDSLTVFERDADKGMLRATNRKVEVPAPVCVLFVPIQ